jgi:hypothetical protein
MLQTRTASLGPLAAVLLGCGGAEIGTDDRDTSELAIRSDGSCSRPRMFIMGTPRNFGVAPGGPLEMTCSGGRWAVEETFAGTGEVFHAGAFKFHDIGEWSSGTNWGDSPPFDGQAEVFGDGNDIIVQEPGTYSITFDDRSFRYELIRQPGSCPSTSMYLRGSFNGWGRQEMFCVGSNRWAAIPMFIGGSEEFKFDARGDWSSNWGDSEGDGIGDRNGRNIRAPGSGRYLITLDETTGRYELRLVSAACSFPTMYLRGSFNGWGLLAMECENGHYAINLNGGAGTEFKFDAYGDWTTNFGDDNGDFAGDRNGRNIFLTGRHHVHFYNDDSYTYDRH